MSIIDKIKEMIRKMTPAKTIEDAIRVTPAVSDRMSEAIELWSDMYVGQSPWLREPTWNNPVRIASMGLPSLIASEKARMATLEMESEITAPMEEVESKNPEYVPPSVDGFGNVQMGRGQATIKEDVPKGPTERAEFLNDQYKKLKKQLRRQLEYGIAKGGIVIKPYIVTYEETKPTIKSDENKQDADSNSDETKQTSTKTSNNKMSYKDDLDKCEIEFDFVQADRFFPLSFDANGKVVEAAFIQTKADKDVVYIRLEYHKLEGRTVTVQNMAFESKNMRLANSANIKSATDLGHQIPLSKVPEWASMQETTVIENVDRLLFAYFRMPEANTVDPYSPLGVSGYSRVVDLIKDADMQYSRLLWEFEAGEMAIDVDRDALKLVQDENGNDHTVLPQKQQRLFRKIDLNAEDTYNVFAPTLRDDSIVHGLNTILMRIEDATGLSRGTLSEATSIEAKTATELKILKQRSYATNGDIQQALEDTLRDVVYVMDVYCDLYDATPDGDYEISFEWDDSIIVDSETELAKRITLMQNGLASKLENRMWYFGETENQAKEALQKIADESKADMETNIMAQSELGVVAQQEGFNKNNNAFAEAEKKGADNRKNPNKQQQSDANKKTQKDTGKEPTITVGGKN